MLKFIHLGTVEGFLGDIKKNNSNQREYNTANIVRLDMVLKLRSAGMNIAAIKEYIELSNLGDETIEKRKKVLEDGFYELDKQITELKESRKFLVEKIEVYSAANKK